MPIGYLDVPEGIEIKEKKALVKDLYEAINEAWPYPNDHRIYVREWSLDSVSQNGQLGSEPAKPVFTMHVPPDLPVTAKRRFIKGVNVAIAKAYDHISGVVIFFLEYPQDRVSIDGKLNSDDQKHLEALSRSTEASSGSKATYQQ